MRRLIYVAGPLWQGVVALNIRHALEAAEKLFDAGFVPFVPHLTHFWNFAIPHPDTRHEDAFWMKLDHEMLKHCDCLVRLPGASIGADMEVEWAQQLGLSVFMSVDDAIAWLGLLTDD